MRVRSLAPQAALLLALLALGIWQAVAVWSTYRADPRLPLWDMAGHGWQAVELARDLAAGRPLAFLAHLNAQDKWPFGFSLWLLPFVFAGRSSFASATLASTVLYALVPVLLAWALAEALAAGAPSTGARVAAAPSPAPPWSSTAGWLALPLATCFLLAPLPRLLAIVVMRELAGIAGLLAALALTLRAGRIEQAADDTSLARRAVERAWRWAAGAALALTLVKFNYGLLWLLSLAAWRTVESTAAERRAAIEVARSLLWPRGAGTARWTLAAALWTLAVAAVAGVNPGIGIWALLVVLAVAAGRAWWRQREAVRAHWAALGPARRGFAIAFVAPLWLWWLSPAPIHPKEIWAFLVNRPGSGFVLAEVLAHYPKSLLADWAPTPAVGLVLGLLALGALVAWRRLPGARLVLVALAVHWLAIALHGYRQPRFLASAVPLVLVAAGLGLASLLRPLGRGSVRWTAVPAGLLLAASLALPAVGGTDAVRTARLAADWQLHSTDPQLARLLGLARRRVPERGRLGVLGGFNELSPSLLQWAISQRSDRRALHFADPPSYPGRRRYAADGSLVSLPPEQARQALAAWLADEDPTALVLIEVGGASAIRDDLDFRRHNAWQQDLVPVARKLAGWRRAGRVELDAHGLALVVMLPARRARVG